MDLSALGNDIERVVASEEQIQTRLKELAEQVKKDYEGRDLILVGVLKGAVMAMADFSRYLQRHVDMDWMAVSSYGAGTKSSGVVRILKDLDGDILGREVLIIEDILDTGLTLSWLRKPDAATVKVEAKYVGFDVPSEFVVGYGLDFNQKYRNLPFIGVLAKHLYS